MGWIQKTQLHYVFMVCSALLVFSACVKGGTLRDKSAQDSGVPAQIACVENSECPAGNVCENGFCTLLITCDSDDDCAAAGKVCHNTRGICVQCDGQHENECPEGQTCQFDFTCVSIGGADAGPNDAGTCEGACGSRDDCAEHLVCSGGSCCPPPSRCQTSDDCPRSAPECNAATGACFGGDSCNVDQDCVDKPGCPGITCACDLTTQPGVCRPRQDECQNDMDCYDGMGAYDGKYCALRAQPKVCLEAPPCTDDIECSLHYLVCDQAAGSPSLNRCINGIPCPMGNECPGTQTCLDGTCVGQNCINTPSMCTGNETCNTQTGRCEMGGSSSCMMDTDCPQGQYCNTASMACLPGCRDNNDCPMGSICDAAHQCTQAAGGLCGPCASDADCPAGTECFESQILGKLCRERCLPGATCTLNPQAMCFFFVCSC